ncbi:MAG TPA: hypothetical protein VN702_17785 [Acetobacteraceae bacterium]|nr:hypothetical protein [Acetobacteraceae bacterium]
MTERDELPEGWMMHGRRRLFYASTLDARLKTGGFPSEAQAIAAAWRIVVEEAAAIAKAKGEDL